MQNAATGARKHRNINVFPALKRIHAEYRIAVIPFAVNGVAPISVMRPGFIREVFEVGLVRIGKTLPFSLAFYRRTMNFLQENDVGPGLVDSFAHGFQHETTIAATVSLVDIIGEYANRISHSTLGLGAHQFRY